MLCAPASAQPSAAPKATPSPAPALPPTTLRLRADRIDFYYDRYLIEATGHVRVQTSNGMTIVGDTFSMDLRLNRFLIASNVHLRSRGGNIDGAAIADFLDFNRIYFVPVIQKPDRWTYENGDFLHPLKGRQMPGDVFYFPDVGRDRVSFDAKSALIESKHFARFSDVRAFLLGAIIPLPSFYVYFGVSQDLVENSLSGANYDTTWNATGNANSISAAHIRYDQFNHLYLGFEQHFAGNDPHEYAVFSVSPFTKDDRYWNLVTGEHIGSKFEIDSFSQLYTNQQFLAQPTASAETTYITMTQALHRSSVQTFLNQTYYNLIGPEAPYSLNHPSFGTLTWTSYNNEIFKSPLYLQTHFGLGFNHDSVNGLYNFGGYLYTTIWNQYADFTFSLPNVKIGNRNKAYAQYYLNASLDTQRQWYSIPHYVNTQNSTISLSRQYSRFVNSYLSYNVDNTSDIYRHAAYTPSIPNLPDGTPYTPFAAFHGAATLRTLTWATTYAASPNLVSTLSFIHHQDFPAAYPGLFTQPPLNAIGQYTYSNYLGQPPWQVSGEVRARLFPHLVLDLQRTYYFHFGSQIWSPSFVVQLST